MYGRGRAGVWRGARQWLPALFAAVVLAAGGCRAPAAPPPAGLDVRHYDVALTLEPETRAVRGEAALVVRHRGVDTLPLDLGPLTVEATYVNDREVTPVRAAGRLLLPLDPARDSSRVSLTYAGVPEEGLYAADHAGLTVVYSDAWPDRGRGWLPARHHPSDPATLDLALTVPRGYEAVASGAPAGVDTLGGTVRYRWSLDAPAPTYTFAFAVSDFSVTADVGPGGLPVRYYMLAPDSAAYRQLARTPQVLAFFEERVGPYAYDTYATVEVPFSFGGMENAAASFVQAALFARGDAEATAVHEAAHQWFGNRVPIADWRDLWLSEGTATYLTTLFYEAADGPGVARARWADMAALTPRRLETHTALVPPPPVDPDEHLTWVPYQKGASVLHLLRLVMGDDAFFRALRRTYAQYAGRPLSTAAFESILEAEHGAALDALFAYWVYGETLPTLHTTWDAAARTLSWRLSGDDGTLAGVPFLLELSGGNQVRYEPVGAGRVALPDWSTAKPVVRPVGVMLRVE